MTELEIGLGLDDLQKSPGWKYFTAFMEGIIEREDDMIKSSEDGIPTSCAKARWRLANTLLSDIDDTIKNALSELKDKEQKGVTNG